MVPRFRNESREFLADFSAVIKAGYGVFLITSESLPLYMYPIPLQWLQGKIVAPGFAGLPSSSPVPLQDGQGFFNSPLPPHRWHGDGSYVPGPMCSTSPDPVPEQLGHRIIVPSLLPPSRMVQPSLADGLKYNRL